MKLFYRDQKRSRVELTPGGAVLLCEFQKMQKILDGVLTKARAAEAGQEGKMTIALLLGQIINDNTRKVLNYLEENYPKIEVEKISGGFRDLRTWLEDGTADTIITYEEEAHLIKDSVFEEVAKVDQGFLVPRENPLSRRSKIRIRDLEGQKIIFPDERETFTMYETFVGLCNMEGFEPVKLMAPDLNHMNMMAEMGKGILISREDSITTRSPDLKFFPSTELGKLTLVVAWKKNNLNPIIPFYHKLYEDLYHAQG